jgi:ribosomal protein S18 acetylase RimI-like enzyme
LGGVVAVRDAKPDDADELAELHVWTWRVAHAGLVPDEYLSSLSAGRRADGWRRLIGTRDRAHTLVAGHPHIVGFVDVQPSRDGDQDPSLVGEVTSIYVHPSACGTGVAQVLLDAGLESLRNEGMTRATLWVLDTNQRAITFYRHGGWTPDGGTKTDDSRGFLLTEVRFYVDLPPPSAESQQEP